MRLVIAACLVLTFVASMAAPVVAGPTLELGAGPYIPIKDTYDFDHRGYELTLGCSAPATSWLQLVISASYTHAKSDNRVLFVPARWPWHEDIYGTAGSWDLFNLSFDGRFGWGMDGPNRIWGGVGFGWYYLAGSEFYREDGRTRTTVPQNALGGRLSVGGSLALSSRTRLGLRARYTYTDYGDSKWPLYVAALQVQAFFGFEL